jgi:hypothetical protein
VFSPAVRSLTRATPLRPSKETSRLPDFMDAVSTTTWGRGGCGRKKIQVIWTLEFLSILPTFLTSSDTRPTTTSAMAP